MESIVETKDCTGKAARIKFLGVVSSLFNYGTECFIVPFRGSRCGILMLLTRLIEFAEPQGVQPEVWDL